MELYGETGTVLVPDPNFFGGEVATADHTGRTIVEPWEHPFGKINEGAGTPNQRANYRSAGLADMMNSIETGKAARCGLDVALHVVDVMTSILKAGQTGQMVTLTTTCIRPDALSPDDAAAMLK
jgi:predicted dehydrogenase